MYFIICPRVSFRKFPWNFIALLQIFKIRLVIEHHSRTGRYELVLKLWNALLIYITHWLNLTDPHSWPIFYAMSTWYNSFPGSMHVCTYTMRKTDGFAIFHNSCAIIKYIRVWTTSHWHQWHTYVWNCTFSKCWILGDSY